MKYAHDFLCLDERDSPNLSELAGKSRSEVKNNINKRHFGICGVIIPGSLYPELNVEGRKIQERVLNPGVYLPFHYVEILNKKEKWAWTGKDQGKYKSLCTLLNNLVLKTKFKIIASFVNKTELAIQYGRFTDKKLVGINRLRPNLFGPSTPKTINLYTIALKVIIQKFYDYLSDRKKRGLIIAEARGEKEDKLLLDAFYNFQKSGAGTLSGKQIRTHITDLLIIRKSQNHIGCQLADLITYPLYDYFVPGHNTRVDHFIKQNSIESKIFSIDVFPRATKKEP